MGTLIVTRIGIVVFLITTLSVVFPISLLMTKIDLTEQSNSKEQRVSESEIEQSCLKLLPVIGIRHICRKIVANSMINGNQNDFDLDSEIHAVKSVLEISPAEPAYWITLAKLEMLNLNDTDIIINDLRLSYVTGRSMQSISEIRFSLAVSLWDQLDLSDKYIAINDLKIASRQQAEAMSELIVQADDEMNSDITAILKVRDRDLARQIRAETRLSRK